MIRRAASDVGNLRVPSYRDWIRIEELESGAGAGPGLGPEFRMNYTQMGLFEALMVGQPPSILGSPKVPPLNNLN